MLIAVSYNVIAIGHIIMMQQSQSQEKSIAAKKKKDQGMFVLD
jgi:hypothetical protein